MSATSYTKSRFSASDAALVLIDHQSGIMQLRSKYCRPRSVRSALGSSGGARVRQGVSRGAQVACAPSRLASTALGRQHSTNHFPQW